MSEPALSIVVPCYNEAAVLRELHRRVTRVCIGTGLSYEILLINDGSSDATWPMMASLAATDPAVRAINLSRNHGHQLALSAGLTVCRGQQMLILDADLQDPPELLPDMLKAMDGGADVVYGQRVSREAETWFKLTTARWFYRILDYMTETPIPRDTGDFRLVTRRVIDLFNRMPERQRYVRGMIAWIGFKQVPIHYSRQKRFAGETKYPLRRMIRFAADAVTSFSVMPLKISIWVGLISAGLAVMLMGLTIIAWLLRLSVAGWASVFTAISFFAAVQLFVLGIIGEYLARVVDQGRGRPLFIIDQVVGSAPGDVAGETAVNGETRSNEASPGQPERVSLPPSGDDTGHPVQTIRS